METEIYLYKPFIRQKDGKLLSGKTLFTQGETTDTKGDKEASTAYMTQYMAMVNSPHNKETVIYHVKALTNDSCTMKKQYVICDSIQPIEEYDISFCPEYIRAKFSNGDNHTLIITTQDTATKTTMHLMDTRDGKIITPTGYSYIEEYSCGLARVVNHDGTQNFIDHKGKKLLKKNVSVAYEFSPTPEGGFTAVKTKDSEWHIIGTEGKYITETPYTNAYPPHNQHIAVANKDGKFNIIDNKGKQISDEWYDDIYPFWNGYTIVTDNNKGINYLLPNGKLLLKDWAMSGSLFINNSATIRTKNNKIRNVQYPTDLQQLTPYPHLT